MKDLLDLLVTSETKRQLLKRLWKDGVEASAHQLASLTGCSYASVYEELEQMAKDRLVVKTTRGRANLYRPNLQSEFAEQLNHLLGGVRQPVELKQLSEQEVVTHLADYGAPLGSVGVTERKLSLEETLVVGVLWARKNSTVARVLPVVLAKNAKDTDFANLFFLAQKEGVTQEVGFFLDLTGTLIGSRKLKALANTLRDRRIRKEQSFFVGSPKGKYAKRLEEQNTPKVAKKWHFSMNMGLDSFQSLFGKTVVVGE